MEPGNALKRNAVKKILLVETIFLFIQSEYTKTINRQKTALHNFTCATVLLDPDVKRGENMLCIYNSDNRREKELAMRYAAKDGIKVTAQ